MKNETIDIYDLLNLQPGLEIFRSDGFSGEAWDAELERLGIVENEDGSFQDL